MKIQIALPDLKKKRATAWVIVYDVQTDAVLMLKRAKKTNNPNLWNFPGGGVDGQDLLQAAKRELREEAGIKVKRKDLQHVAELAELSANYFVVVVDGQPALKVDKAESSSASWMQMAEILKLGKKLHPKTKAFVDNPINLRLMRMLVRKDGAPLEL